MKYGELVAKIMCSERAKISKMSAHQNTKNRYIDVINTIEALCQGSVVTKFWFFRTTDTYNKLMSSLALPKDFGHPRDKLSQTQRKINDYNEKLRSKMKRILKEYLIGDRQAAIAKVDALD